MYDESILIPCPKRRRQPSGRHDSSSAPQGDQYHLKHKHTTVTVNKCTHLHASNGIYTHSEGSQSSRKIFHQFKRPSFFVTWARQTLSSLTPCEEDREREVLPRVSKPKLPAAAENDVPPPASGPVTSRFFSFGPMTRTVQHSTNALLGGILTIETKMIQHLVKSILRLY
jgi:hypothetical protein